MAIRVGNREPVTLGREKARKGGVNSSTQLRGRHHVGVLSPIRCWKKEEIATFPRVDRLLDNMCGAQKT